MVGIAMAVGCAEGRLPERLTVVTRTDDGDYVLAARDRGDLRDPRRLSGDLGRGYRGGRLDTEYHRGGQVDITWTMDGDTAVPLDEQGLILWSFWYHLADTRAILEAHGFDLTDVFPVSIAWTPQSVLDFRAAENAAFVLGQRTFVLFPDALDGVPVAANAGVVRHETGHALFEVLVTGTSGGRIPWIDAAPTEQIAVRALNEGFADMVATLTLDEPRFIDDSIPQPDRDVAGDAVAGPGVYPPQDASTLDVITFDPYRLGTVYASFVWDVREATDPDTALALAAGALTAWGEAGEYGDVHGFVRSLLAAADGDGKTAGCASAAARFPDLDLTGTCP
jgi:hypothetical protein